MFPYLLSDGVRGRVHPPSLDRGLVGRFYKGSVGHQLQFIILQNAAEVGHKLDLKSNNH